MENHAKRDTYDPAQALSDVTASRQAMAARLVTPWWYHPLLGLNLGVMILVIVLDPPTPWFFLAAGLSGLISFVMMRAYRRITGLWVSAAQYGPRARRAWIGLCGVLALCLVVAFALRDAGSPLGGAIALAVACGTTSVVIGRRIDALLRDEVRDGTMPIPAGRP